MRPAPSQDHQPSASVTVSKNHPSEADASKECSGVSVLTDIQSPDGFFSERGYWTSIAIGTDGLPIISYHDRSNLDLKVYNCGDPGCSGVVFADGFET